MASSHLPGHLPGRPPVRPGAVGWDLPSTAPPEYSRPTAESSLPLSARILSLLADPRIDFITATSAAEALGEARQNVETALDTMLQGGYVIRHDNGVTPRYTVPPHVKAELEADFREAAVELGEHAFLTRLSPETSLVPFEDEEPRLPATAGLLSLFLPGTGQLLNGDIGRASLVFSVWSLAWITHLSPVWTFVCLYAGAEAFLTAKIRSMERKLAEEQGNPSAGSGPKKLPSPRLT